MLKGDLKQIFIETASLASIEKGKSTNFVYSQSGKIREPELREILGRVLSKKNICYGIEVPTKNKYSFSGQKKLSARIDLSIYENAKPVVHIELKEGRPTIDKIEKDFQKLLLEEIEGTCFFHVINGNCSPDTISNLFSCYKQAYLNTKNGLKLNSKWFMLFIFVTNTKEFFCHMVDDISTIKEFTPLKEKFS